MQVTDFFGRMWRLEVNYFMAEEGQTQGSRFLRDPHPEANRQAPSVEQRTSRVMAQKLNESSQTGGVVVTKVKEVPAA